MTRSSLSLWLPQRNLPLIACVLIIGLTTTFLSWQSTRSTENAAAQARFDKNVSDTVRDLGEAMMQYERLLQSGASYFATADNVSRKKWFAFSEYMQLEELYAGIQGFGYAPVIEPKHLAEHVEAIRAEGFPTYEVRPTDPRQVYVPINYIEPFSGRNLKAFGFDMYSETARRTALDKARDTGRAALTAKVTLVQEGAVPQAGTLMYMPVYRKGAMVYTQEEREEAIQGFIFASFRMGDLMDSALGDRISDMAFELYDGDASDPERLLFQQRSNMIDLVPGYVPMFDEVRHMQVGAHQWTLRFVTLPAFDAVAPISRSMTTLAGGLGLTLLFSILLASLSTMRVRAQALADNMSQAYRESEARVRSIIDSTAEGLLITDSDPDMTIVSLNPAGEYMLGTSPALIVGQPLEHLLKAPEATSLKVMLADIRSGLKSVLRFETQCLSTDQGILDLSVSVTATQQDDRRRLIILISDLTELHQAQRAALEASALSEAIFKHAPLCITALNTEGVFQSINPAGEEMLGYTHHELVDIHTPGILLEASELEEGNEQLAHGIDHPSMVAALAQINDNKEREINLVRKDGTHLPVSLTVTTLRNPGHEITGYLAIAYDITERKRSEDAIRHLALHDPLTGLPNRNLMIDRMSMAIERAKRNHDMLGVMLLDLDRFKAINDTLGHDIGDEVLRSVGQRLRNAVRQIDTVVRVGGDEFVILLGELKQTQDADTVANKILHAIRADLNIADHHFNLSTSIGIALYPQHGQDLDMLLKSADVAMYEVKKQGKNSYRLATTRGNNKRH